jgi:hypothetical protein
MCQGDARNLCTAFTVQGSSEEERVQTKLQKVQGVPNIDTSGVPQRLGTTSARSPAPLETHPNARIISTHRTRVLTTQFSVDG